MALLPYSLRPRVIIKNQIIKRGLFGGNEFLSPVALMLIGQSRHLRRMAARNGVVLGRPLWRIVGLALVGQEVQRRMFKKAPEVLAIEKIGPGGRVQVKAFEPNLTLSRRERRVALRRLESESIASVEARTRS